ncbi:sn-glycerol-3-phosphate ABC transporter ATP-binding protein UgpC [Patulibacter sp. SYSU D01012]|uniref:ABC transporter ATP-binding protein n=1 Tax=Patulibacter sp. SYSU D01012 TaxID=2817381 RepID=UPI001B316F01|nr:sn-glycerol-3-phosphate ABC transporter ATP-binding protein UgpC [Patulibacter sp. SYSU D01012]
MARIQLHGIHKRYADGFHAVKGLDLDIADGEFVIFVGPSGCGKSTALRMIAGLEEITEGELLMDGERVNELEPKDRDISMVFQSYALYPHMTVAENLAFPLKMANVPKDEIAERVREAAEVLQLHDHLGRKPANLSGGQRQRVAMGRAIVRQPRAFLMDEPLSNLDAKLRVQTRTELARLQRRLGTTTIYVTHDQTEAMTLGDRVAVLNAGVLQQVGTPAELYTQPRNVFVAGFIGSPAMNFVAAEIHGDEVRTARGPIPLPASWRERVAGASAGQPVVVGIRPEAFSDADLEPGDGPVIDVEVEVVESMGSDLYAYFDPAAGGARSASLDELSHRTGLGDLTSARPGEQLVARLSPASGVRVGQRARLRIDAAHVTLFDPETGLSLAAHESPTAAPSAA